MAHILDGSAGMSHFAPLSTGQALEINNHLLELIGTLQSDVRDLRRDLGHTDVKLDQVGTKLAGTNGDVEQLQESMKSMDEFHQSLDKNLGRNNSSMQKLQQGLEGTDAKVLALTEALKVAQTDANNLRNEIIKVGAQGDGLRTYVETELAQEIKKLDDCKKGNDLLTEKFVEFQGNTLKKNAEFTEAIRVINKKIVSGQDDLAKSNTVIHVLEQRMAEMSAAQKVTRQNLEETNAVVIKVVEDHEVTKNNLAICSEGLKKTSKKLEQTSEGLERTMKHVGDMHDNLDLNVNGTGSNGKKIEALMAKVQQLSEGQEMINNSHRNMEAQLSNTDAIARQTQSSLREANALLMPNVVKDPTAGNKFRSVISSVMQQNSMAASGGNLTQPLSPSAGGKPMTPRGGFVRRVEQSQQSGAMKSLGGDSWA